MQKYGGVCNFNFVISKFWRVFLHCLKDTLGGKSTINIDNFLDIWGDKCFDIFSDNFWNDLGDNLEDNFWDIFWIYFVDTFRDT